MRLRRFDRGRAVGMQPDILGPAPQQQVQRAEQRQHQDAEHLAAGAPAAALDQRLQPRQDRHRADPDAGKRDADRQPAAPHEPMRQIRRLHDIGEAIDPAAAHRAERQVKLPRLARQGREQQPRGHRDDADLDNQPRPAPVDHPADKRRDQRREQKAERKHARRDAAIPAEILQHWRVEQREGGPRVDPDRHRHKRDADQHPAVEERQAEWLLLHSALDHRNPCRRSTDPRAITPEGMPASCGVMLRAMILSACHLFGGDLSVAGERA
jgi:hypothetical protein